MGVESERVGHVLNLYYLSITVCVLTAALSLAPFLGLVTYFLSPVGVFFTLLQAVVIVVRTKQQRRRYLKANAGKTGGASVTYKLLQAQQPSFEVGANNKVFIYPTLARLPGIVTNIILLVLWVVVLIMDIVVLAGALKVDAQHPRTVVLGVVGGEAVTVAFQIFTLFAILMVCVAERKASIKQLGDKPYDALADS
ncbi:hypothetical protein FA15DRAFT_760889 [Coprinopsis marcescibilis]|uniref:Uncharacterized protein n=1 Tax=Coprinopsis marcescibilis TaxID=230819 RepID=A0A5C3KD14_COPMA|nr:hypothetical protein FA15DRAFT_760889 [Coprinopsis marcescibilis]